MGHARFGHSHYCANSRHFVPLIPRQGNEEKSAAQIEEVVVNNKHRNDVAAMKELIDQRSDVSRCPDSPLQLLQGSCLIRPLIDRSAAASNAQVINHMHTSVSLLTRFPGLGDRAIMRQSRRRNGEVDPAALTQPTDGIRSFSHPTEKGAGKECESGIANRDGDDERGLRETDSSADAVINGRRERDGIRSAGPHRVGTALISNQWDGREEANDLILIWSQKDPHVLPFASTARVPHVGQEN